MLASDLLLREQGFPHFQGKEHQARATSNCNIKGEPPVIANYITESTHSFKSSGLQNDYETGTLFCSTQATKNFVYNGKLRCHWKFVKAGRQSLCLQ